ncbi:GNAT family N-acetyltransferase [Leifsonia xyli]|uniref:GNAT family N-acetyltransferase n=1 Tax=Leifsonia xyli TaxID=1575 RepID=UPI003D671AC1
MSAINEYADEAGYPDGNGLLDDPRRPTAAVDLGDQVALSAYDMQFVRQTSPDKYAAWINGEEAATLPYRRVGGRVVLLKTTVDPKYRGKGVATEFIGRVLDELRHQNEPIAVYCPLVRSFINEHPQYASLLDTAHPGLRLDDEAQTKIQSPVEDEPTRFEEEL